VQTSGPIRRHFFKFAQVAFSLADQSNKGENCNVKAQHFPIKICMVAPDKPGFFQRPHATQAGRCRDSSIMGQFNIRDPTIRLKITQDFLINFIQFCPSHSCTVLLEFYRIPR
tara:strand:- start:32 stop:370 length:339 start_codon:yes stop_codon:yes gene_type:complete